jgi:FkbM family methyltransferase
MTLPFKMRTETEMEKYRAESFWTKEPETISWLKSFNPQDVFFDVGANIGVYSLFAASLFPTMLIFAFEPMPENYEALSLNRNANGFKSICCMRCAVGNSCAQASLTCPDMMSGATGAQISEGGALSIRMMSIDGFFPKPTHVKIDIDGQELEVVKGMVNTLPHIKSILIEVSSKSKGSITEILLAAGFSTDNRFNSMSPHSRERRLKEGIDAENIIFDRRA